MKRADATEVVYENENMRPACKYPLYYYVAHAKEEVVQGWRQEGAVLAPAGVYTVTLYSYRYRFVPHIPLCADMEFIYECCPRGWPPH